MMNDTIREELQSKMTVHPRSEPIREEMHLPRQMPVAAAAGSAGRSVAVAVAHSPEPQPQPLPRRQITAALEPAKTSPTLVRFQDANKDNVPDWRAKLKESVQKRKSGDPKPAVEDNVTPMPSPHGTQARSEPANKIEISDDRLAKALARIESSKRAHLKNGAQMPVSHPISRPIPVPVTGVRVARPVHVDQTAAPVKASVPPVPVQAMPKTVAEVAPIAEVKRDTNRLPELRSVRDDERPAEVQKSLSRIEVAVDRPGIPEHNVIHIPAKQLEIRAHDESEVELADEIEDLAPFSMRFAAGLFDGILAAVASAILLSPLAFYGFEWISTPGFGLFAVTTALVMFIYSTLTLGFFGKTLGLRLFALELVDAVENEYPTMKQAAINSAVYIASIMFLGAGFATVFFNDENRAAHDLLSGTILVKEF
jgi:uncharacterized RDD family membrane protein YckC